MVVIHTSVAVLLVWKQKLCKFATVLQDIINLVTVCVTCHAAGSCSLCLPVDFHMTYSADCFCNFYWEVFSQMS